MHKLIFAAALLTQVASGEEPMMANMRYLASAPVVTLQDNGKTYSLKPGNCIHVRLTTNPSTGYDWYLAPGMNEAMNLSARTVTTPGGAMPGAPSQLEYVLCAAAPGTVVVKLLYYRPWEKNTPPAQTLTFTVKITK